VRSSSTGTVLRDIDLVEGAQQIIRHVAQVQCCGRSLHPLFHRETHQGRGERVDFSAGSALAPEVVLLGACRAKNVARLHAVWQTAATRCTPAATEVTVCFHLLACKLEESLKPIDRERENVYYDGHQ